MAEALCLDGMCLHDFLFGSWRTSLEARSECFVLAAVEPTYE
eukprot:CAMPEP_0177755690 /NCGR_PEP_ID=MMETSP0491_2-20121128/2701_1 /TAXON_ID=63592 /ORGANISM="Tetraselmis chuii, Strain PLY429" /LENGTH=41 /DNA_ID= /DNA_START= /DNA_END= /DNA_ORIENTATION=